jgi:hypothetical protein
MTSSADGPYSQAKDQRLTFSTATDMAPPGLAAHSQTPGLRPEPRPSSEMREGQSPGGISSAVHRDGCPTEEIPPTATRAR